MNQEYSILKRNDNKIGPIEAIKGRGVFNTFNNSFMESIIGMNEEFLILNNGLKVGRD